MPREKIQRGRRKDEKQRKSDVKRGREENAAEPVRKRPKSSAVEPEDFISIEDDSTQDVPRGDNNDQPFYGLLDNEEQEYFSRANDMLELNQFGDPEERRLFVESVYEEAKGKELKIACSQSCSRLLEKLISLSEIHQIRRLFNAFLGHFLHLVQHRFASHCCETLFIHAAPGVPQKSEKREKESKNVNDGGDGGDDSELPLVDMFLRVIEELEGNWGYLLTERFASHTIRVLLLVLAGEPVDVTSNSSVVASRKKERPSVMHGETQTVAKPQKRTVPESFIGTLKKVTNDIISGLDDTYLRALATHPTGNPVLQVMLSLGLSHSGKSSAKETSSITKRLIPDESLEEGTESATFLKGLLYDPVGSRLLETLVRCSPGKLFKNFHKNIIQPRVGSLARNETASYVVLRVLERIGKDDLQSDLDLILPEIPGLLARSRLIVPRALIERCLIRGVDVEPLVKAIKSSYADDAAQRLRQILKLDEKSTRTEEEDANNSKLKFEQRNITPIPEQTHGSLCVQTMLRVPGDMSGLIHSSLLALDTHELLQMAKSPIMSHILQEALTQPTSTAQFRRQFVPRFLGHVKDLAIDTSGSHLVDALWPSTKDIFFVKERIAQELVENEAILRDSFLGRAVWRNWFMDLYKRRRGEWVQIAKRVESDDTNGVEVNTKNPPAKSKIDMARARFVQNEERAKQKQSGRTPLAARS